MNNIGVKFGKELKKMHESIITNKAGLSMPLSYFHSLKKWMESSDICFNLSPEELIHEHCLYLLMEDEEIIGCAIIQQETDTHAYLSIFEIAHIYRRKVLLCIPHSI